MTFLKLLQFLKIFLNFSTKCIDKLKGLLYYINIEKEINNKRNGVFYYKQDIKENIAMLAQSQGFYGRLLNQIEDDEAVLDNLYEQSVQEGWKDAVDMVMSIES